MKIDEDTEFENNHADYTGGAIAWKKT